MSQKWITFAYTVYNNNQSENEYLITPYESENMQEHNEWNKISSTRYLGSREVPRLTWFPQIEVLTTRIRTEEVYIALAESVLRFCPVPVWSGAAILNFGHLSRFIITYVHIFAHV